MVYLILATNGNIATSNKLLLNTNIDVNLGDEEQTSLLHLYCRLATLMYVISYWEYVPSYYDRQSKNIKWIVSIRYDTGRD